MSMAFKLTPAAHNIAAVEDHGRPLFAALLYSSVAFLGSYAFGLNNLPSSTSRFRILSLSLLFVAVCSSATLLVSSFVFYKKIGRYIVVISASLFFAFEACLRLVRQRQVAAGTHRIVICSSPESTESIKALLATSTFPIEVVGIVRPEPGEIEALIERSGERSVHEVVVQAPGADEDALLAMLDRGVAVSTLGAFSERHFLRIPARFIAPDWFFHVDLKQHDPFYNSAKRLMDVMLALAGGLAALPIVVLAALLIKVEGGGPVFYRQTRVGLQQRPFTIWKLRTMLVDSERAGPQWAKVGDSRVTRVGRVLRKSRIDELPQFWNILVGEMTFVGPRPERPEFAGRLADHITYYRQRHLIKPGLTGWAQICYPYGASIQDAEAKLSYDLYYMKHASVMFDCEIILRTITAIARGSR